MGAFERRRLTLRQVDWRLAGEIKPKEVVRSRALRVALAHERDAAFVVDADEDFEDLPVENLYRIREEPL